jgi:hypothetical protein
LEQPCGHGAFTEGNVNRADLLQRLSERQRRVAMGVINSISDPACQLMSLQGSAGTGETFTVARSVSVLRVQHRNSLICATAGIAAVQYPGGCTLHSLFKLGIDEESRGGFASHIGQGSVHGEIILRAGLLVIDEVSMLTPWVANRVCATIQCIASNQMDFGGRKLLFVGDLLQLPPVVPNYAMSVAEWRITRLTW